MKSQNKFKKKMKTENKKSIKSNFITILLILFVLSLTVQIVFAEQSEYYMLTYAVDKDTDELIPAHINVFSHDGLYDREHDTSEYPFDIEKVYFYNVPVNKLLHAEYASDDYYVDVDDYYFDSLLDTCQDSPGETCSLDSNGYNTECENYEIDSIPFLYCSVYNNGQSFAFIYDFEWNTITTGNYMHCVDSDDDGVCDKDEPIDCIDETPFNLPSDTACQTWTFDYDTGCHISNEDDGSTLCDFSMFVDYSCVDGTLLGSDVFKRETQQYCGVYTGECDGSLEWTSYVLEDDCSLDEYCIEGQSSCFPCTDTDFDGVCDDNDDCIGENLGNLPVSTTCRTWTFDYDTGCHISNEDDGSTLCDFNVDTRYECTDGTALGDDVFSREADRTCGVYTGECDGSLEWNTFVVLKDLCNFNEYCVPNNPECQQCIDLDNDLVCDNNDLCVGENLSNLPEDTTCRDWSFNEYTGCHEYEDDDGSSICESDIGIYDNSCVDGTALGQDVFRRSYTRYCGNNTGSCNGEVLPNSWSVSDDCDIDEYCVEGNPVCQEYVIPSCTGAFATCRGSGTIFGSLCYNQEQNNVCINPPVWSCSDGSYVNCNEYDDSIINDNLVVNFEPTILSCSASCTGSDCCYPIEEFNCNSNTVCSSSVVNTQQFFCFNDGTTIYMDVLNNPPIEFCTDGIDNDCDGFIDENCPLPLEKSIDVSMTPRNPTINDDIYCYADIVNDQLNEIINYEISGDITSTGTLLCNNSCTLSLRIESQYTNYGDNIKCEMNFETYSDNDEVNVEIYVPKYKTKKIEPKTSKISFTSLGLLGDEFVHRGDSLDFMIGFRNKGDDLENLRVRISLMNIWGALEQRTFGPLELEEDSEESMVARIEIPEDMDPGLYYARISLGEGDLRRIKHRMFYVL